MIVGNYLGKIVSLKEVPTSSPTAHIQTLREAKFTCACCGFRSRPSRAVPNGYMHVMRFKKAPTVFCWLCAGTRLLGSTVNNVPMGLLIYAPSWSQKNVTDLVRISKGAVLMQHQLPEFIVNKAHSVLTRLRSYDFVTDNDLHEFFEGTAGSTREVADLMLTAQPQIIKHYPKLFRHIRFLPSADVFSDVIKYYIAANPREFQYL